MGAPLLMADAPRKAAKVQQAPAAGGHLLMADSTGTVAREGGG
jgi:hypothetical protein